MEVEKEKVGLNCNNLRWHQKYGDLAEGHRQSLCEKRECVINWIDAQKKKEYLLKVTLVLAKDGFC